MGWKLELICWTGGEIPSEPVRFELYLTGQMIVIGGFGRPEHSNNLVLKLSVVVPGLGVLHFIAFL